MAEGRSNGEIADRPSRTAFTSGRSWSLTGP